eukprot:CAMPEP_0178934096 /NCGR_PEP_ID=MMETSP0786-20121207/23680_1 /TAXON_ID=186022 /ORGANISM="Thalassionema frauenfeldii, Strain CCMP 1798" /LENGTH=229 /DNA_ID=CAMNT_0020611855 /DNA_START=285 /DNA_END=975 /DNA_ORIENTATION=-
MSTTNESRRRHSSILMPSTNEARCTFVLPTGTLGVAFTSSGDQNEPAVSQVMQNSKMYGKLKPGYKFEYMELPNGEMIQCDSPRELAWFFDETSGIEGRRITCRMSYPDWLLIHVPDGYQHDICLGLSEEGKPVVAYIEPDFPDYHEIRVGMAVEAIVCDNGYELTGCNDVETLEALIDSDNSPDGLTILTRDPSLEFPAEMVEEDPQSTRFTNQVVDSPPTVMEFASW